MSKNVLILNGSPRKHGNTVYLIGKLTEGIRDTHPDAQIDVANLAFMKIGPCRACDACRNESRKQEYCIFNDDMSGLYDQLIQADAFVIASPIYWFTVSSFVKLFLDRLHGLRLESNEALKGKRAAVLLVYCDEDAYVSGAVNALHTLRDSFGYMKADYAGAAYGRANQPGDAEKNEELTHKAYELGKALLLDCGLL
jgi:multimeric flavodoxin WrbA